MDRYQSPKCWIEVLVDEVLERHLGIAPTASEFLEDTLISASPLAARRPDEIPGVKGKRLPQAFILSKKQLKDAPAYSLPTAVGMWAFQRLHSSSHSFGGYAAEVFPGGRE